MNAIGTDLITSIWLFAHQKKKKKAQAEFELI